MASSAQPHPTVPPPQQQQQLAVAVPAPVAQTQAQAQAQQPKPTRVSLSYEEISKLFSLPIAEAASILGVCTSVLKRICRTHGIVRWPYRKSLLKKQFVAFVLTLEFAHIDRSPVTFQGGATKSQQGSSKAGQVSPPGKQNASILAQGTQTKAIPTYMDDFKYGFPSPGLSPGTMKWWGTDSHTETTSETAPAKDENCEAPESTNEASKGMTDDELDWEADEAEADSAATTEPSAQLCSLRRKAVDDGRKLLTGKACRGQELCRLNKRQKMALAQVFGASLPEQLRSKLE
ncbi:hypothetical protein ABZP36_024903 [Zizania latifolia]